MVFNPPQRDGTTYGLISPGGDQSNLFWRTFPRINFQVDTIVVIKDHSFILSNSR